MAKIKTVVSVNNKINISLGTNNRITILFIILAINNSLLVMDSNQVMVINLTDTISNFKVLMVIISGTEIITYLDTILIT